MTAANKRRGIHAASILESPRLQRALGALEAAGAVGLTTAELQARTGSMAPATDVAELRAGGHDIACAYEGRSSAGRRVYRYRLIPAQRVAS